MSLPAMAIEVLPLESGDYAKLITAAPKPALVLLWSVDCAPCQREMPELARLTRASRFASVVLISTDDIDKTPDIGRILRSAGFPPNVKARVFGHTDASRLRYEIDPKWHGETPRHYFMTATKTDAWSGPLYLGPLDQWQDK
jgi:thiol-disulfide isomerase/thioredoxin